MLILKKFQEVIEIFVFNTSYSLFPPSSQPMDISLI